MVMEENQNPPPQPPVENPAIVKNEHKPPGLKSKWPFLAIAVLLVLVGIFGGYFVLNQKKQIQAPVPSPTPGEVACTQEAKICPDGSSVGRTGPNCEFSLCPASSSAETADWKTYDDGDEFSFKYPANIFIEEAVACNFVNDNNLGLFKKRGEKNYLCGSDEPYYFYVGTVSKKDIDSNDSCYTNTKETVMVDNIAAEKYTITFRSNDKECLERGIGPISNERNSVYIISKGKLYLISWPVLDVDKSIYEQMLSTFKFTENPTPNPDNKFCGGFAGKACPNGYTCKLDGNYPDAGGTCVIR